MNKTKAVPGALTHAALGGGERGARRACGWLPVPALQLLLLELGTPGEVPGAELIPDKQFLKHTGLGSCAHTWGAAAALFKALSARQEGRAEAGLCHRPLRSRGAEKQAPRDRDTWGQRGRFGWL